MSDFLSAVEIAERLNKSKSWIIRLAKKDGWEYKITRVQGGECKLFKCPLLTAPAPAPAEIAVAANQAVFENFLGLTVESTRESRIRALVAHDKMQILDPLLEITDPMERSRQIEAICKAKGLGKNTVYRWLKRYAAEGMHGLLRKTRTDRFCRRVMISKKMDDIAFDNGLSIADYHDFVETFRAQVRGLWAQGGASLRQVTMLATAALKELCEKYNIAHKDAVLACKDGALVNFIQAEKRFCRVAIANRDAKGFYDRHTTAIERSRADLKPGEIVFGDVSPCDIPVLQPDGTTGWARLIAWQDAATNMLHITGYLAPKGSSVRREHVAQAFAAMCEDSPWGLPKKLYLDNGSEYSWNEMLDAWRDLAKLSHGKFVGMWDEKALGDEGRIYRSIPFKPRAKSLEGQFSNLLHFMAWHKSFAGSDRMRKKVANLGKAVIATDLDDLKKYIGEIVAFYHATPQSGHLGGVSPIEKMAQFQKEGFTRVTIDREALSLAFSITETRKVQAGCVKVNSLRYYHPKLHQYDGEMLEVKYPKHAPDCCFVFNGGRLLCVAALHKIFEFTDPEGAKYAAKLAREAREATKVMEGQVVWLDPRELMGEFARLQGVTEVIQASRRDERRITLKPEIQAMLDAKQAALDEILAGTDRSLPTQIRRFDIEEAPEVLAARAMGL